MIKCLECGYEATRLQWTHFKFNCTGKFKNGKEYKEKYPDALLVDPIVAKSTSVTLENLIRKYGDVEGNNRWKIYREKQAISNSFEYKQRKYGWSREQFDEYNSSRAVTIENMIRRHGENLGVAKWQEYCKRQAYTNTKKYFIKKYGVDAGYKKYLAINKQKATPTNPLLLSKMLHISIDDAVDIIIKRQKNYHSSSMENEFADLLEKEIGVLDNKSTAKPFGKWSHYLNTYVVYDIRYKNCIIEFNGDYWHANPAIYKDNAIIRGRTADSIRNHDMLKLKTVEDLGFRTLTVWENEFKKSKKETIKRTVEWILNEQK
jgi:hypothetical protein